MTQRNSTEPASRVLRTALLLGASVFATCSLPAAAFAQDQASSPEVAPEDNAANTSTADQTGGGTAVNTGQNGPAATSDTGDEIVVTGVRASLQRARDIKRTSSGVVDAVSAEEIGKFPDTNLAESLQRIPGVSIERRAGEGNFVTVRGFGPTFNLVTVNGRQLATSDVGTVGTDGGDFGRATSRSFDFSNLASEGVSRLEVYKTGRANIPSGGIGAAINVVTQRPLEGRESGLRGSVGAKALYDTSLDNFRVTPELSGVVSWSDPNDTFGVSLFGAYQKRKSAAAAAISNDWNITTFANMPGRQNVADDPATAANEAAGNTVITNAPSDPNQLVAIPNDSRYDYSKFSRERINLNGTVQFKPFETLTLTADALYAQNKLKEDRAEQTNWFNRPFDHVTFDDDDVVATAIYLDEGTKYGTKDIGFENIHRQTKNKLHSYGLNANWEIAPGFTLNLDGNTSKSKSGPDSKNGNSSTLVGFGAPVVDGHSVDYSGDIPQQVWTLNDSGLGTDGIRGTPDDRGNNNGVLDIGDLGTQIARTNASYQTQRVNQFRADLGWDFGDGARFDVGATRINSKMRSTRTQTQQALGDWGIGQVSDINTFASDIVSQFCLGCQFEHYNPTNADTAFMVNAEDLYGVLSPLYAADGEPLRAGTQAPHAVGITGLDDDRVKERVTSIYAQLGWKGDFAGRPAAVNAGIRWETTKVQSDAVVAVPDRIQWDSDNDFSRQIDFANVVLAERSGTGKYSNFLPSVDFRIEPIDNLVARVSVSKTLARPDYGNLFASESVNAPNRPTYLGGVATGTTGNPNLKPLVSGNLDISLEYYYARSSYVSAGFFAKNVKNFIGQGTFEQNLFGLRDQSSGAAGTRSGIAVAQLGSLGVPVSDVTLFTYTALLVANNGNTAATNAQIQANLAAGGQQLNQTFVDQVLRDYNVNPLNAAAGGFAADPLFIFNVTRPINNRTGKIHGVELQGQHFFGNSGFGLAASLTKVFGDVNFDRGSNPGTNVFALTGLSDSANVTGIFEKYGFSARVAYNWRGKFLSQVNLGGSRNPRYFEPFGTLDFSLGYDVTDRLALSFEGINVLGEDIRMYGRSKRQVFFAQENYPRYYLGARYRFGGGAPTVAPAPAYVAPPAPPAPATQTCPDGSVIDAAASCPVPPPPPAAAPSGERG
ncbi:TonB-dependent receptor [Sphingomonas piscis]|uniref:TonB-dependent receptor n=1 Tax=Sphingomonas piscis TaxID=2714943 RepID=A0A6G7YLZ0_9SPHN|nr:TonB-dependent receptor [Sphingomonas piscis]QIK77747.1 TonB-dependent receptor [Sphingomonas piscis]